jgi:hypothetical protein
MAQCIGIEKLRKKERKSEGNSQEWRIEVGAVVDDVTDDVKNAILL